MPYIAPVHPLNRLLAKVGIRITRAQPSFPEGFIEEYNKRFAELRNDPRGFDVYEDLWCDTGEHPVGYTHFESAFASSRINRLKPESILDIGSYRLFILGLLAGYKVTTIDVRKREPATENETVITCDAKSIKLPDGTFDAVVSLCTLEHFGLGRYGDDFDRDADKKAFKEMVRVLKPGGHLIFTTTLRGGRPAIAFNGQRLYSLQLLHELCAGLSAVEERFFSRKSGRFCKIEEVTSEPRDWDVYCGCWKKNG